MRGRAKAPGLRTRQAGMLAGVLALMQPPHAHAWGSLLLMEAPPVQDTLAVGGTAWSVPRSPTGAHQSTALTPALDYQRHDGWFASTESGVGLNLSSNARWQAGARWWPQFGRARQDATPEAPRLGTRLQQQVFANAMLGDVAMLQTALSHGSGRDHHGLQTELGLTSGIPIPGGQIGLGVATTYGNRVYRRDYTGIDSKGWSDWSWTLSLDHRFNPHWHADAQYQQASIQHQGRAHGALVTLWRDL
jgi:outer membrane scaffolding protein for murein synthesis (MipA/OmpV family)